MWISLISLATKSTKINVHQILMIHVPHTALGKTLSSTKHRSMGYKEMSFVWKYIGNVYNLLFHHSGTKKWALLKKYRRYVQCIVSSLKNYLWIRMVQIWSQLNFISLMWKSNHIWYIMNISILANQKSKVEMLKLSFWITFICTLTNS